MTKTDGELLAALRIAHDTSTGGSGLSLQEALTRTRYRELREGLGEADVQRLVAAYPALVGEWLAYSEDKRTSRGWYLLRNGEIGRVGAPESRLRFGTIEEAVAGYVVRELDFWANLGAG